MEVRVQKLVPTDLREWIEPGQIIAWLEQAGEELDRACGLLIRRGGGGVSRAACSRMATGRWVGPRVQSFRSEHCYDRAPIAMDRMRLFCLLGFSYSASVFSSQEIIRQCYNDFWFRRCSGQAIPFRTELIAFRRRERVGVETILVRALESAMGVVYGGGMDRREMNEVAIEEAKERLEIARHLDSCDEC